MDETYGNYVGDACFDFHDYDDAGHDTDDDADDDTADNTNDDTGGNADDCGRGNLYPIKVQGSASWSVLLTIFFSMPFWLDV